MGNRTETDILDSVAANEVWWWYRFAGAALGAKAIDIRTGGGGGGCTAAATLKPTSQILAVAKERRVRTALAELSPEIREVLRLWAEAKVHGAEIVVVFAEYGDLVLHTPRCLDAYERWTAAADPSEQRDIETWLVWRCVRNKASHELKLMLEDAQAAVRAALGAYLAYRKPPSKDEMAWERENRRVETESRATCRAPRASVAGDFCPAGWGR